MRLHSSNETRRRLRPLLTVLAAALAAAFGSLTALEARADTLPTGGRVVAGQASISKPSADSLQVHQDSARAVIDWRSFSVGKDASVTFQQPSSQSSVLNRVTGSDPSQILGRIQANGQVFLVNPYGVVFGRDARVDVAGLVASTVNIRNADFMAGRLRFDIPGQPGAQIVNEGSISVRDGGLAAFIAPGVANRGTIEARLGTVALASGAAYTLDPYGDRLIQLVVPDAQLSQVVNSGTLSADGGSVQISTRTAAAVVDSLINLGGSVRARSVGERQGRIVLEGGSGDAGRVVVGGSLDASGRGAGERGGSVQVRGGDIQIAGSAVIDASGQSGGGSVQLGGGWQGAGSGGQVAANAVARTARIDVSALGQGAGGEAVVWSDGQTRFEGRIEARGGTQGGDGGRVEVSGHRLAFDGTVDASAAQGTAGLLLLDPGSLRLQSRNTAAAGDADIVSTEAISGQLSVGTSVNLSATEDITVVDRIDARRVNGAGQRINRTGAELTLAAGRDLQINSDVILDGARFEGTAGGRIGQAAGAVLATGGGDAVLQAGQGIGLMAVQGIRNLSLSTGKGSIELASPVVLGGRFSADVMQATAGDRVRLNGLAAASADSQPAVQINRAPSNSGAAVVVIDDHLIARGDVSVQGAGVSLSASKVIDTRVISGGRAGGAVTLDAGAGGIALDGNVLTEDAAVVLRSQGNLIQANAAAITSGSGAVTATSAATTKLASVQTSGALTANGAGVLLDAGAVDAAGNALVAIQAGTLQVHATGTSAQAVDVRSSVRLGAGDSTLRSDGGVAMQAGTVIEAGASGRMTINAAGTVTVENLKSAGAGVLIHSANGDVMFNKSLGGRAAGDSATVKTLGGDDVPQPTLYALDVRAPEGKIETNGLLLYGLKGAPLTLDLPPAADLAFGLNLQARQVFVRRLVFVLDGAVNIHGTSKVVIGNSIRSANGYAMSIGGGEIDLYRPTRPVDGSDYLNTDIVVAQYADNTLRFFERLNEAWQESTSFVSVVMPQDLPAPGKLDLVTNLPLPLPNFWLDRTLAHEKIAQVSTRDPAFAGAAGEPVRLVSLPNYTNQTPASSTNEFTPDFRLASYDPLGSGRNPFVPLVYQNTVALPDIAEVRAGPRNTDDKPGQAISNIPGTRFVPKILITNDPGTNFTPEMLLVSTPPVTNIGRIILSGPLYETDQHGARKVLDMAGGYESSGDLRNVALKVASFDTRSLYQDSLTAAPLFNDNTKLGACSSVLGSCLDDPQYRVPDDAGVRGDVSNVYSRIIYPESTSKGPRCSVNPGALLFCGGAGIGVGVDGLQYNPVSLGFQARGYLSRDCLPNGCERPTPTLPLAEYYARGEQPTHEFANPNAPTTSLVWVNAQPGPNSLGRFEYFFGYSGIGSNPTAGPTLFPSNNTGFIPGLSRTQVKIGAGLSQALFRKTSDAPVPTRTVLTVSHGIIDGNGLQFNLDGTGDFKTTLPVLLGSTDGSAAPSFSTILPTILPVSADRSTLAATSNLPGIEVGAVGLATATSVGSRAITDLVDIPVQNAPAESGPLLVLGGRGIAQSLDLGRGGALGGVRPALAPVEYEVACVKPTQESELQSSNVTPVETDLPPCR